MRKTLSHTSYLLVFSFLTFVLPSCMTAKVVTQYNSNTIANNPLNDTTVWVYAWGLIQPHDINPHCNPSFNHLNMVTAKTNFGYILISALSLGIAVPIRLEWSCAPPDIPTGQLGH